MMRVHCDQPNMVRYQDLGTYERFLNTDISRHNNITTGQIYQTVLENERRGEYLGQTVQFIPHITDEVVRRIKRASEGYDIAVIEVGGTVGDYENVPFFFALKTLEREVGKSGMAYLLVTYLPVPDHIGEMKTKPTQQAIRLLGQEGIIPDFIICRSQYALDEVRKKKIEIFSHVPLENIIAAPDIQSVYQQPIEFAQQKVSEKLLAHLQLPINKMPNLVAWQERVACILSPKKRVSIAIVGKYLDIGSYSLTDSYISICHALLHVGAELNTGVDITWIDAKQYEHDPRTVEQLGQFDGVIVPGGFGAGGVDGKIAAISYVRTHGIPYLGLCYGMQLAVIEFARNVCGMRDAHTTEVDESTRHPVISLLPMQQQHLTEYQYGGTMRLGAYQAVIREGTKIFSLYDRACRLIKTTDGYCVAERHRHRYEVNPFFVAALERYGMVFSGHTVRSDGTKLMEFIELPDHPYFIATQAHPEFTSRLTNPNPLFYGLVVAAQQHAIVRSKDSVRHVAHARSGAKPVIQHVV
jgi:CTP synthase